MMIELTKNDKLTIKGEWVMVNGRKFIVDYPYSGVIAVTKEGDIVNIVKNRDTTYVMPINIDEIEGYYI